MTRLIIDHRAEAAVSRDTESTYLRFGSLVIELSDEQAEAIMRGLIRALPRFREAS